MSPPTQHDSHGGINLLLCRGQGPGETKHSAGMDLHECMQA